MSSTLSLNVKRLGQILREGAEGQVSESGQRLEGASTNYWPVLHQLINFDFDTTRCTHTAERVFGKPTARFAAVDGSMNQTLLGGLAVFWAGAYAATGTIYYHDDSKPNLKYDSNFLEKGHGLASCVPIYIDSIPEVEPQNGNYLGQAISGPMTEQSTVDNSTIANWIMLFSELYLAYTFAARNDLQVILLDRSLSGTQSSLLQDTSKRALWKRECATLRMKTDGLKLDEQDLAYSRYRTPNLDGLLPPRGDYLRHSAMYLLEKSNCSLTLPEIAKRLNVSETDRVEKLHRYLTKAAHEGRFFAESGGQYSLLRNLDTAWPRTKKMVEYFGRRFFTSNAGNPLQINDDSGPRWLTTLDLAFLCLFTMNMLIETCRLNKTLLIGITKDTTARDLITHLIPLCVNRNIWKEAGKIEHVATTDRMLLQATSMFHHTEVNVPWSTVEYDTAFQTIVMPYKEVKGDVSGAVKNRIIQEQLFVKSYIQLDKATSDDQFRSNVLFIDRLYHPFENAPTLTLMHQYGGAVEDVHPILWQNNGIVNPIQELVMVTLKAMTHESIPEIFGHNEPLYIADKVAKAQETHAAQMIKGMGHWLVSHPKLRRYAFYMNTFRSRRSEIENARTRA